MFSYVQALFVLSALVGINFGSITVYNETPPGSIENYGDVKVVGDGSGNQPAENLSAIKHPESRGIVQHNAKVSSQANFGIATNAFRRKRFIEQNIHTVHKQINISKRDIPVNITNAASALNLTKRCTTQHINGIRKQTNIDMGNRKRAIYQNIDYVYKQINQSK